MGITPEVYKRVHDGVNVTSLAAVPFLFLVQVTRYLEFKTVDGSYVVKSGKINKVRRIT